jgi:hypothetical protein
MSRHTPVSIHVRHQTIKGHHLVIYAIGVADDRLKKEGCVLPASTGMDPTNCQEVL